MLTYGPVRFVLMGVGLALLTVGCGSGMRDAGADPIVEQPQRVERFLIPYFVEEEGTGGVLAAIVGMDFNLTATYTAGLAGSPDGPGAQVTVHLFDHTTGLPLQNNGQEVCDGGCSFTLSTQTRRRTIRIDDLITNFGAEPFDHVVKAGFGIIVVEGDTANVNLLTFVTQSHQSPFTVSPLGGAPVRLPSEGA